ncbi:uroporphyrinogen-III C-methyltransferase [Arhodomonas aquaeolei]|uniref:uroporphyrinogen-III C-methyltransferase n=1 Tax=Arhodomonas aquaeolei TaxID=2369 RepID=UPI00216A9DE3|nr:uroporphyrinogen-III C-methyltransferase [Arhodomonas aquaeolei]MCS4503473.1 uroporphyrinogen-III C-methyltransferase [Arhodomonas aquaeolei]
MTGMPATLELTGRRVLVVGGGDGARRLAAWLGCHGARLRVVAADVRPALREAAMAGGWALCERAFAQGDLDGCHLAVAASDCVDLNHRVAAEADRRGVLVHAVGARERSSLHLDIDDDEPAALQWRKEPGAGRAYLVGAGPGDPKLLTLRAREVLGRADAVLYDRLAAPEVMDLVPARAQRVYVGKAASHHTVPQSRINAMLVDLVSQGLEVVRLKGGDPFVFGRGGEELEALQAAGVSFEVVPGVTAALGCAAYAGMPLTHRDHARLCTFVTGHLRDGSLDLPWEALVQPSQTVVIYMGLHGLPRLCEELMRRGLAPGHPAAVVQRATLTGQRVVTGCLGDLVARVREAGLQPPSLVVLGEVVRLHDRLDWFTDSFDGAVPEGEAAPAIEALHGG